MVDSYKYLGLYMNKKLDWSDNTDALYKKGQSRLFFLRRLRSFDVCSRLLRMFYQSVVASAIFSAVACWGSGAGEGEKNRLNKLVEKASSVVGGGTGQSGGGGPGEDPSQAAVHYGQPLPPPLQ